MVVVVDVDVVCAVIGKIDVMEWGMLSHVSCRARSRAVATCLYSGSRI